MTLTVDDIRARYTGNHIETDYGDEVRFLLERLDDAEARFRGEQREYDTMRDSKNYEFARLRADLARVTEERDEAREERDRLAVIACPNCGAPNDATADARGRILARIRAGAEAAALERAAQELERRASVEGDKKWAAAYRKAAQRIRELP